ncbi:hypothetical protein [Fibrella forsythiae]|uniref:Uncharacterized protein n=1 Tax=Fibrella forsythiae TaxID=2817061 RepID=A0ABS3JIV8_9BACT|nr:hypothetical protein [Fibrella forsythiae]MBO0949943.1 hypothetical protein [Fibrella forsythiae]
MFDSEEFMEEARAQVWIRSKSMPHKIGTMVWYTGRKKLIGGPKQFVKSVGSAVPVPVVSSIINAAIGAGVDKVAAARRRAKIEKGRGVAPKEDSTYTGKLRTIAKHEAKGLKGVVEKIDSNFPKLRDSKSTLVNHIAIVNNVDPPTKAQLWSVALAIYERERYEDKLELQLEAARAALAAIDEYVTASRNETAEIEAQFRVKLLEAEQGLDEVSGSPLLLHNRRSDQ